MKGALNTFVLVYWIASSELVSWTRVNRWYKVFTVTATKAHRTEIGIGHLIGHSIPLRNFPSLQSRPGT